MTRIGAKKKPFYRLVAADSHSPRDGDPLEILGTYDPGKDPPEVKIKGERIREWLRRGAQLTETVSQLLKRVGFEMRGGGG